MYQIPPFQPQSSPPFDAWSCTDTAFIGCVEMAQGVFQQWSVSAEAVYAGTKVGVGTSLEAVVNAANKYGLISYASRPLSPVFNQSAYFAPITPAQKATANKSMVFTIIPPDLKVSPIILELKESSGITHMVVTRDMINYIDSYAPQIKPINWSQVIGQWSIKITPKYMNTFGYQVPGTTTVYVQVGNSLVPLATWQAFINIGGSQASIVPITQQQLDASSVIGNDFFGSKN